MLLTFTGTCFFLLSLGEAGESQADFGSSAIRRFPCCHLSVPCSCAGRPVPVLWWARHRSRGEGALQSLFSHISWVMCQGMGQEGAGAALGGACQGFLHCPGDGAVGMFPSLHCGGHSFCPSFGRRQVTDLSFTHSKKHVCSLVIFKSQWCWLKPCLRIFPSENWEILGIFQMLELDVNIVPWFLRVSRKISWGAELWEHWAVGNFMLQFLYSWCLELFRVF